MATQSYHFVQEVLPEVALDPVRLHALMAALLADRGVTMLGALWEQAGIDRDVAERQPPRDLAGELRRAGELVIATVSLPPPRDPPAPCALAIVARATWGTGPLPTAVLDPRYYVLEIALDEKRGGPAFLFAETALATWRGPAPPDPVPVPPDLRAVGDAACAAYAVSARLPMPPLEPAALQLPPWYWLHVGGVREAIVEVIRADSSEAIAQVLTTRPIMLLPEIVGAIESMGAADADPRTADMFARVAQSVARIHELVREEPDHARQLLALALVLAREEHGVRRANLERALPVVFEARQRMTPISPQFVQTLAAEAFVRRGLADQGVYPVANLTQAVHVLGAAVDVAGSPTARQRLADELEAVRALLAKAEAAAAAAPPPSHQSTKTLRLKPPASRLGAYVIVREYTKAHDYASPALSRELEATLLDETIFGTDTSCTVEIKGAYISPQHCRIVREGERFVLRDHSTNGTFVDGVGRVRERVLSPGDWIAVGLARIQFQIATPSRLAVSFEREPRLHMALPDEVPIGRHPENTIQILDRTVAKHHGRITREGDRHVYRDLGSMNGTRLRGVKIDEHLLEPGDELAIGGARLVYERGAGVETPMVSVSPRPGSSMAPPLPGAPPSPAKTLPAGAPPRSAIPPAMPVESDPPTIPVPARKAPTAAPATKPDAATLPLSRKTPRPAPSQPPIDGPVGPETLPLSRSAPVLRPKIRPPEPASIAASREPLPPATDALPQLPSLRPSMPAVVPARPTTTEPDLEEPRWLALFLDELDLASYERGHDARIELARDPVFAANRGWRGGHVSWSGQPAWPVGLAADHRWLFPSAGEASHFLASAVPLPREGLLEIAPPTIDFDELRTFTGVRSEGGAGALGRIVCMLRVGRLVAKLEVVEGRQARSAGTSLKPYHVLPLAERIVARARGVLGA